MIVRELITKIGFNVDDKKLQAVEKRVDNFSSKMNALSSSILGLGTRLTAFATVPIALLGRSLINSASDAEETASKFRTVFQDVSDAAEKTTKNLSKNFGLSSRAAQQLLGDTGDLLTGFGFSGQAALDLARDVNELAVDLASFTNFSGGAAGASASLTKALLGERESLKTLGISILEADVVAQVLLNTQKGLTFETERQAKAYATLQIAQRQSKNAIGDFARTSEQFANQQRIFTARLDDLSVSFGKILIPTALKAVRVFIKLAENFNGLSDSTKNIIVGVLAVTAAVGPLLLILAGLVKSVAFVASGLKVLTVAFKGLSLAMATNPIIAVVAALSLLGFAFYQWATSTEENMAVVKEAWSRFLGLFQDVWEAVRSTLNGIFALFQKIATALKPLGDAFLNLGREILSLFNTVFGGLIKVITWFFSLFSDGTKSSSENIITLERVLSVLGTTLLTLVDIIRFWVEVFADAIKRIVDVFSGILNGANNLFKALMSGTDTVKSYMNSAFTSIGEHVNSVWDWISEGARDWLSGITDYISSFVDKIMWAVDKVRGAFSWVGNTAKSVGSKISNFFGFGEEETEPKKQKKVTAIQDFVTGRSMGGAFNPQQSSVNSSNTTRNINVNSEVTVQVPQGTSSQQEAFLREAARSAFQTEYDRELSRVLYDNPSME